MEYRALWVKAGYCSKMASAEVMKPPKQDFIRAYYLTSEGHALDDLTRRRLKVARFSDLNDPFELMALSLRDKPLRRVVRSYKKSTNTRTGILCFSGNWSNPVLWSHYADKHKGLCLGFDIRRSDCESVNYETERLRKALPYSGNPEQLTKELKTQLLITKSEHWQYEKEIRRFVALRDTIMENDLHFWTFGPDLTLREVILGTRCAQSIDVVRNLVATTCPGAVVFKARTAFKHFDIVPDMRTVP